MNRSSIDLSVGVFVSIGILCLLFLALRVGNAGGEKIVDPYELHARFDNVGGLKVRGPVKASGVVVGRVTAIHYDGKNYQADVTLKMSGRYKFPRDTFASINTSGLLGEQFIGLEPGGAVPEDLNPGDTITKTQSAVVLEKLIGRFMFDKAAESGGDKK